MADYWIWWALAVLAVGAELFTGTFYLLAVGAALASGGVAGWLGVSTPMQFAVGGVFAVAGCFAAHQWRKRRATPAPQAPLDLGQAVEVVAWHDDGTARVHYRGTQWDAMLAAADGARAPTMYIVDTRGSTLVIAAARP